MVVCAAGVLSVPGLADCTRTVHAKEYVCAKRTGQRCESSSVEVGTTRNERRSNGAAVPAVFWFTGASPLEAWLAAPAEDPAAKLAHMPALHSAQFLPDRVPTLRTATEAMTVAALAFLAERA